MNRLLESSAQDTTTPLSSLVPRRGVLQLSHRTPLAAVPVAATRSELTPTQHVAPPVKQPMPATPASLPSNYSPFTERLGYTSDHTPQSLSVSFCDTQDHVILKLTGATWNMQMRCRAASAERPYANNPLNIEETEAQFQTRRSQQFVEINELMDRTDFIFLQEAADLATNARFRELTSQRGWDFVAVGRNWTEVCHKGLVTLYNAAVLTDAQVTVPLQVEGKKGSGVLAAQFACITQDKHCVTLVNVHLDYTVDYTREDSEACIGNYLKKQVAAGMPTIMGGDTNHAPSIELQGMIGHWDYPTNIDAPEGQRGDPSALTTTHRHHAGLPLQDNVLKHYDGFFICPTDTTYALAEEQRGKFWKRGNHGRFEVCSFNPRVDYPQHWRHHSPVGRPWVREVYRLQQDELTRYFGSKCRPMVLHPVQCGALYDGNPAINYDDQHGLIYLKFADTAAAHEFVQPLLQQRPQHAGTQGPDSNLVPLTANDAKALALRWQALYKPVLRFNAAGSRPVGLTQR